MLNHQNKQQNEKFHIDLFLFIKETFKIMCINIFCISVARELI